MTTAGLLILAIGFPWSSHCGMGAPTATAVAHAEVESDVAAVDTTPAIRQSADEEGEPASHQQGDLSAIESKPWRDAIRRASEHPAFRAGSGRLSLMRVLFEDRPVMEQSDDAGSLPATAREGSVPVLGGVPLFIPGGIDRLLLDPEKVSGSSPDRRNHVIQLMSTKLVTFDDFPNGGGRYREVNHGEFIIVEHINSSRRRNGRDPVRIGSFTHAHTELEVEVPPQGQLGIVGDVILQAPPQAMMGRVVAEMRADTVHRIRVKSLRIGPCAVGGIYGQTFAFTPQGVTGTSLLPPGTYEILMPDFDMVKSRWTITVEPGQTTYLQFVAKSPTRVELSSHAIPPHSVQDGDSSTLTD